MTWADLSRWAGAVVLLTLGLVIVANPLEARRAAHRGRSFCWVPFVGGMLGAAGVMTLLVGLSPERIWFACVPVALNLTYAMLVYVVVVKGIWEPLKKRLGRS